MTACETLTPEEMAEIDHEIALVPVRRRQLSRH